jgi:hypothetical protein
MVFRPVYDKLGVWWSMQKELGGVAWPSLRGCQAAEAYGLHMGQGGCRLQPCLCCILLL